MTEKECVLIQAAIDELIACRRDRRMFDARRMLRRTTFVESQSAAIEYQRLECHRSRERKRARRSKR